MSHGRRSSVATALALAVGTLAVGPAVAAAHGDGDGHLAWVAPAAFLLGVGVLAVSVHADHVDAVPRRAADVGVALGVVGLLVGVALVAI